MNLSEVNLLEDLFGVPERSEQREVKRNSVVSGWRIAKRLTLILLLAGAFMFYYLLDKLNQGMTAF